MILASERRYADSHPCAKATHPEAHGIGCGASRPLKGVMRFMRRAGARTTVAQRAPVSLNSMP
jgi:hypothetical protein